MKSIVLQDLQDDPLKLIISLNFVCPVKATNQARINGITSGETSYALISTPESVYVWSYTTQHSDPVVLTFPVRSKEPSLASLVSPSAGSHEPGLILVKPGNGQIAYWDAVGSAIADGLIQRAGVQTVLPFVPGETATYLCNAEPAGFVVATSKGNLYNVSVRDSEGRPHLSHVSMSSSGGAWFSGLLPIIGGSHRRGDIVAVKAGANEGHTERREVFVASKKGGIEKWEMARGGVYRLSGHGDIYTQMYEALQMPVDGALSVVDFADVPGPSNRCVILASYVAPNSPGHAIFLCSLPDNQQIRVLSVTRLSPSPPEHSSLRPATFSQPQIYVPSPGKSAFIAYSRGFSIITLPTDSSTWPYLDTVTFRDDHAHLRIIGSGQEDLSTDRVSHRKLRNPGIILVVQGAGVIRCETFDNELDHQVVTHGTDWIQSKIEQAVFYGVSSENPLDFKPRHEWNWKVHDVEGVAVQISTEILTSSISSLIMLIVASKYTQLGLLLEELLAGRCHSLLALAQYLRQFFPEVSFATRQKLLLDAEKAEAARQLWKTWSKRLDSLDTHERGAHILESVVKDMRRETTGEAVYVDVVREWFRHEVSLPNRN
jgi:nuclear pore complex protein Nup133